jgi:hypothetical protein
MADPTYIDQLVDVAKQERTSPYAGVDLMWWHAAANQDFQMFDTSSALVESPDEVFAELSSD